MSNLIRMDRNVANNILNFDIFEEDQRLVKNIIAFFAKKLQCPTQQNTFGGHILDPVDFAKTMGYKNYQSLLKAHPNPYQFKNRLDHKEFLMREKENGNPEYKDLIFWNSILDNALYRIFSQNFILSNVGKTPNGLDFSELKKLSILDELRKTFNQKTKKILYYYRLHPVFVNNLARYFFKMELDVYKMCCKTHKSLACGI